MSCCQSKIIHSCTQEAVEICQETKFKTIETHCNVTKPRCSMLAQGVMNIVPGVALYIYIMILMPSPANHPKFMIIASATNVPTCFIHGNMLSFTCWNKRATFWHDATSLIPILPLFLFALGGMSAGKCRGINIKQEKKQTRFLRCTGGKS